LPTSKDLPSSKTDIRELKTLARGKTPAGKHSREPKGPLVGRRLAWEFPLPGGQKHANIYAQFGFSLGIPFKLGELVVHPNFVVSGLILVLALSSVSTVQAQVTMDASNIKITCDQFVHSKVAPTRTVAAWLSGFYNGKRDNRVIDLQSFEANLSKLENFCYEEKNYKLPVMQAVEKVIGRGK
jgi:acid stress chaperone HdeB